MRLLPVAFVVCLILMFYVIYVFFHAIPLLQLGEDEEDVISDMRVRGIVELIVFHIVTIMMVICYAKCILTHPGRIPIEPAWLDAGEHTDRQCVAFETKSTGERRQCKRCRGPEGTGLFKPDRCHHCRLCGMCILKMDHHCPWIYNCVGYANHKFFFLLLCYTVTDLHIIFWTMIESTNRAIADDAHFVVMFALMYGLTVSGFMTITLNVFLLFHAILLWKNMSTIEYCEKSAPRTLDDEDEPREKPVWFGFGMSKYDMGPMFNIKASLGENPLLWFLPVGGPMGDGTRFRTTEENYQDAWASVASLDYTGEGELPSPRKPLRRSVTSLSAQSYGRMA